MRKAQLQKKNLRKNYGQKITHAFFCFYIYKKNWHKLKVKNSFSSTAFLSRVLSIQLIASRREMREKLNKGNKKRYILGCEGFACAYLFVFFLFSFFFVFVFALRSFAPSSHFALRPFTSPSSGFSSSLIFKLNFNIVFDTWTCLYFWRQRFLGKIELKKKHLSLEGCCQTAVSRSAIFGEPTSLTHSSK